jgi:hypothetical protein
MQKRKIALLIIVLIIIAALIYGLARDSKDKKTESQSPQTSSQQLEAPVPTPGNVSQLTPRAKNAIGLWRGSDAKFTREFKADGTVTDRYEGDASATTTGAWSEVVDTSTEPFAFPDLADPTFLKMRMGGETYYYLVSANSSADMLHLVYLNGNGSLHFTRVK